MGKICWINGQPYLVSLPRGGKGNNDLNNLWDEIINFLGEDSNEIFHWRWMYSWCQESVGTSSRAVRGFTSARSWNYRYAAYRGVDVGFRPVLIPLNTVTMKPDPSLLADIPNGTRIALTSLYMDGMAIPEPQYPTYDGDIADYIPRTEIALGDRDACPSNWLHVIKYRDLLWMDRNILKNISWAGLKAQGLTD